MTLYQLTEDFKALLALAEDPDVDPEVFQDTLEGLEGEIEVKAEGYAIVMGEVKTKKKQIESEVARLNAWIDILANNLDRMSDALMTAMDVCGKKKLESEHFRFSIVGNGGKKPMRVTDKVPEEYMRMKPEIDTARIREALESGEELPFAHLEERGRHLSIR